MGDNCVSHQGCCGAEYNDVLQHVLALSLPHCKHATVGTDEIGFWWLPLRFENWRRDVRALSQVHEAALHRKKPVGWPPTWPCLGQVTLFQGLSGPELADRRLFGLQHRVFGVEGIRGGVVCQNIGGHQDLIISKRQLTLGPDKACHWSRCLCP